MKIIITTNTLRIDDSIVIDASKKLSEKNPKGWTDPQAFKELGDIWQELKEVYVSNGDVNETLKELVIKQFGVKQEEIDEVEIEDGIPEHWKEMKEGKIKFR